MLVVASPDNSLLWTVFLNQKCAMVSDSALSITEVVLSVVYCLSRIWRFLRFFFFKVVDSEGEVNSLLQRWNKPVGLSPRSTEIKFEGSPVSTGSTKGGLISVQFTGKPPASSANGPGFPKLHVQSHIKA
ncbi:uncharacterized protein LOC123210290 isoform X1 [Mangifera indica]|uniref:uncharacterized protein LOC123210290 isoform X1 n=1 Tax=Mangifera indica TaxID=29780 RepID=UPI001CFC1E3D|nr:uncharacterized protein LOC123210290 isoform X1 [Mangifera indica]